MPDELPLVSAALEYGFNNIAFTDVMKRMDHGQSSIDALHGLLKTRASAEERYAKALRTVPDAMSSASPLVSLFRSSKAQVKSDLGTFHAALSNTRQQITLNAAKRADFANLLWRLSSIMESLKSTYSSHYKKSMAQVSETTDRLKKLEKQLAKAESAHDKAITDHRNAIIRYQEVQERPGDFSESEKRKRFNAQVSASDQLRVAVEKLQQAKEWVQAARAHRVSTLADVAEHLERIELYRLQQQCSALRDLNEAEKGVLSAQVVQHKSISEVVETANAEADLRMFIHKSRLNSMSSLHEHALKEDLLRFQKIASVAEEITARKRLASETKLEDEDGEGSEKESEDAQAAGTPGPTPSTGSRGSSGTPSPSEDSRQGKQRPSTPPRVLVRAAEDIGMPRVSPSVLRSDGWGFGSREYAKQLVARSRERRGSLDPASLHERLEEVSASDDIIPIPISEEERRFNGPDAERVMEEVRKPLQQWIQWLFSDSNGSAASSPVSESEKSTRNEFVASDGENEKDKDADERLGSEENASTEGNANANEPEAKKEEQAKEPSQASESEEQQTSSQDKDADAELEGVEAMKGITRSQSEYHPPSSDLHDLVSTRGGVAVFAKLLNTQRGRCQELSPAKFSVLAAALRQCLDVCEREGDVNAAKVLMILGDTFYKKMPKSAEGGAGKGDAAADADSEGSEHVFLRSCIEDHSLWKQEAYWEEAFYRSVREEIAKMNRRQRLAIIRATDTSHPVDAADMDITQATPRAADAEDDAESQGFEAIDWRARRRAVDGVTRMWPGSKEWEYTYTNMVFGQLGSYSMNMRSFGLSVPSVRRIVRRLALGNGLPKQMLEALLQTVDTTASSGSEQTQGPTSVVRGNSNH